MRTCSNTWMHKAIFHVDHLQLGQGVLQALPSGVMPLLEARIAVAPLLQCGPQPLVLLRMLLLHPLPPMRMRASACWPAVAAASEPSRLLGNAAEVQGCAPEQTLWGALRADACNRGGGGAAWLSMLRSLPQIESRHHFLGRRLPAAACWTVPGNTHSQRAGCMRLQSPLPSHG